MLCSLCDIQVSKKEFRNGMDYADLLDSKLCAVEHGLMLTVDPVILSDIFFKSPSSQFLLLLSKPRGCPWQIWDDEYRNQRHEYLSYN